MALEKTPYFLDLKEDPELTRNLIREQLTRVGAGTPDSELWDHEYASLWVDDPPRPGKYYTKKTGAKSVNNVQRRVEQVNTWIEWTADAKRDAVQQTAASQIREFTQLELVEDETRRWITDQDYNRFKTLVEQLVQAPDEGLDAFDDDLSAYEQAEKDYADNLAQQETANLVRDTELRAAGNGGIFSDTERTDVQARVTNNAAVAKGGTTGVTVPEKGAPRGRVTLDGEVAVGSAFYEIEHDEWAGGTMYHPRCVLDEIPEGVDETLVFMTVYDSDGAFMSHLPFAQRADGKWETPTTTSGIARTASQTWKAAVAYGHQSSDYEITERVSIVPPNSAWSNVKWGGRDGSAVAVKVRGGGGGRGGRGRGLP